MRWSVWTGIAICFALSSLRGAELEVNWSNGEGFRRAPLNFSKGEKSGFKIISAEASGVTFTNELRGHAYLTNAVAHNGSGVALGDVDGDGWVDIFFCNLQGPNRLFRNLGNWKFEEKQIGAAAGGEELSTAANFVDVDGDRDLDLLVNGISAGTRLFLNDGKGGFAEMAGAGLSRTNSATSMALADIDGDGDLDLYCAHYIDTMYLFNPTTRFALARKGEQWIVTKVNDQPTTSPKWTNRFMALPDGRVRELPEAHALYRNEGGGKFLAIQNSGAFTDRDGKAIALYRDWGLAVMFRDLNGDGAPDIYVCNDNASPDRIWINNGKGVFRPEELGMFRHFSRSAMGIDFADVNRDGHEDFIVLDMLAREHGKRMTQLVRDYPDAAAKERVEERPEYNRNSLFLGGADGSFTEAAFMAGVAATDWSWCPIFVDVDLDGYEDLLVTNGFEFDVLDQDSSDNLRKPKRRPTQAELQLFFQFYKHWPTKNAAFRNRGDGTFEAMNEKWGFENAGISYGMALGDLDNDGDLDVVINNLNESASLYRNEASAGRVAVRLKGTAPNTEGVGAKIKLVGGAVTQSQEIISGGRYLSGDQAERVFAANASAGQALKLEVKWRNGTKSVITNIQANHIYEVDQASAVPTIVVAKKSVAPFFKDVSAQLGHKHVEADFDDASRQPLLPRRLSKLGPGLSWFDVDGDGWEDLIVGAGRGGKLAILKNEQGQKFQRMEGGAAAGDLGAVVGWPDGKGNRNFLAGLSNYEMSSEQNSAVSIFSAGKLAGDVSMGSASVGPLAVADVDGDGDLDVFGGERFRPGRYPEACSGMLWINDNGELRKSDQKFDSVGLINGATFADLDGDGAPELALALEWGPVRIFRNDHGAFKDVTADWGLAGMTGWWSGISAGDFDGDGRIDLAAGNWGRNSEYELYQPGPLRIFYDDSKGNGVLEIVEAWKRGDQWMPVRDRLRLAGALLDLPNRFATHEIYGAAAVPQIFGERYAKAKFVEATELRSMVFLNRGGKLEARPLPREAQMAPGFSINVGDFDGDGLEDLFLSQNFFGSASDINRDDSGRGLWLRGKGDGTFVAQDSIVIGVKIYGEQRGAALADFNQDGRVDLAVSQNNAETKLYLNERAKRGLRISLKGPVGNPDGIGAQMRFVYGERKGPVRVVQGGSGYWSQDGASQVLGFREFPESLWIRWPGGKEQSVSLQKDVWNITVNASNN